ncbi:protein of unknown function [Paraburkholderia kururiensis]
MSAAPTDLPDDIEALKAMVASLREQLSSRAIEIEHLKLTIAKLRRMQFGRKSEKLDRQIEQLELRLEDLQADEGSVDMAAVAAVKRPRLTRAFGASLQSYGASFHRSGTHDSHADRGLLLRYPFGASSLRGGSPQPCISLVLSART